MDKRRRGSNKYVVVSHTQTNVNLQRCPKEFFQDRPRILLKHMALLAAVQEGCFTQAAKCSKCRLKYSTHGFDQTDLMSFKLVYPLIKHIVLPDVGMAASQVKSGKNQRRLFARPLDN